MSIISAGGAVTGADAGPTIDPRDYFFTKTYTGTGSTLGVTGVGFQPDLVWIKDRQGVEDNCLFDRLRNDSAGTTARLNSNTTGVEVTGGAFAGVSSFDADGFTLGGNVLTNRGGRDFVAWNWKANGAGVSNTDGTITSTVSANTDSGFSIVTYTGTGSAATVGHGLGVVPKMVIVRRRSGVSSWRVMHIGMGTMGSFMAYLENIAAASATALWNSTSPTLSVFSVGTDPDVNGNTSTYVAYCFAEIADFSKFSSYTGNGSATGPSITTDFEPTFLMIKRIDSTGDWIVHDSARDATNPRTAFLEWNTADAEATGNDVDFNSTSFQIKSTSATVNASGGTYIYMCIA
jgi:hypothetical protein